MYYKLNAWGPIKDFAVKRWAGIDRRSRIQQAMKKRTRAKRKLVVG
jgi:hypothetical protein